MFNLNHYFLRKNLLNRNTYNTFEILGLLKTELLKINDPTRNELSLII